MCISNLPFLYKKSPFCLMNIKNHDTSCHIVTVCAVTPDRSCCLRRAKFWQLPAVRRNDINNMLIAKYRQFKTRTFSASIVHYKILAVYKPLFPKQHEHKLHTPGRKLTCLWCRSLSRFWKDSGGWAHTKRRNYRMNTEHLLGTRQKKKASGPYTHNAKKHL